MVRQQVYQNRAYPAAARAVGAKGTVSVKVLIDENGNVVSAICFQRTSFTAKVRQSKQHAVRNLLRHNFQDNPLRFQVLLHTFSIDVLSSK